MDENKKRVWSALEQLWYGVPLRVALSRTGADLLSFFSSKRKQSIYIPAFDKNLSKEEYKLLLERDCDIRRKGGGLELVCNQR